MAEMESDFFSDTSLIGLSCNLPGHRICWTLNRCFSLNFSRNPGLDVQLKKIKKQEKADVDFGSLDLFTSEHLEQQTKPDEEQDLHFAIYEYVQPLNGTRHLLYKLKNGDELLLPEVKQLDYLWMIQSETAEEESVWYTQMLREVPAIQLAQLIEADKLKRLNYLLI